ncbi:thiol-disulfide oxidoreductase DCC family protein [Pedobacter montanisoli]|uniref:DCC1-like thiol-disulfide oxidoreductase family protein n=1 Tax=Pedobacter montanisoli TaxID=2923277 RepID=A0ABT0A015_9SPHI|nr:DCC1-like thiol-disulfide oxidoreductase family protein [Pedobacter montanisoli]MCJ0743918.1 DCC1-like thiol-disulfide oxidoreductase family protein [Pedobacter montanisoli]
MNEVRFPEKKLVVFFDGECNLCNRSVQFIIKRDRKDCFSFASLQGETAKGMLADLGLSNGTNQSIILWENGRLYRQSDAALRIVKRLNGFWSLLYGFIIIPAFIRNPIYNYIARNRYKWFGKADHCLIPAPELKHKFLP